MNSFHGRFVWYELITTDVEAAKAFYSQVMGWSARDASVPGIAYSLFAVGEVPVSGLMDLPEDAGKMGAKPGWLGYVGVDDVDAAADRVKRLGGTVLVPPTNHSNISRVSIFADPQLATLALVERLRSDRQRPAGLDIPGGVGWHELLAGDWQKALAFYAEIFGWQKTDADMAAASPYQLFSTGGRTIGGMYTKPATTPAPFWLYYFNIGDIDAAAQRVKAGGGQILSGPDQVLGGSWIVQCADPQGAIFALEGTRKHGAIGYFEHVGQGRRWSW